MEVPKMSSRLKSLGIDQLSVEERIALVQEIWDSVAASPEQIPLTDLQKQELDRRLAAHLSNPKDVTPWEEVKAQAQARLRG
jgi:putative addiction module component (TIGR02574 family)